MALTPALEVAIILRYFGGWVTVELVQTGTQDAECSCWGEGLGMDSTAAHIGSVECMHCTTRARALRCHILWKTHVGCNLFLRQI